MKIAIAGYGLEGKSNYTYWNTAGNELTIIDERTVLEDSPTVATILGPGAFNELGMFDMVVRTAGLAPYKLTSARKIWSSTNEFFEKCPVPIIGVTGTKGKGTTASMIAALFEATGKKVWLLGNIGKPALDVLASIASDDIVVYELSSFQLWDLERSPHTAVVLLIEPDHLNVHQTMEIYVQAKARIRKNQKEGDTCVYHPTNQYSRQIADSNQQAPAVPYGVQATQSVYEKAGSFWYNEHIICSIEALQLKGRHNIENACAALTVAKLYDLADADIEKGLQNFQGLPHRLEYVRTVAGVDYYNDSFSSAPAATVAAIRAFEQPEVLIIGGVDKGADFTELANTIQTQPNIREVLLIGTMNRTLAEQFATISPQTSLLIIDEKNMNEIVAIAAQSARPGDVVILSPACASFDMFKDFYDRGTQFREQVQRL